MRFLGLALLGVLFLAGCASLQDTLNPRDPEVSIDGLRLAEFSSDEAQFIADLRISNPNAIDISLAGFDYRLRVAGTHLLSGEYDEPLELKAREETTVAIPFRVAFADVLAVAGGLEGLHDIRYTLEVAASIDVALLGQRNVQAVSRGQLSFP